MKIFMAFVASYLLGSIPTGYIICRIIKGVDICTVGSGNTGATNVARVVGKGWGIFTLVLDVLKGLMSVILIPWLIGWQTELSKIMCAIGVVSGHNWTVFLRFRGGKGVATTSGALIGLVPIVFLSSFCIWCIVFIIWRYVSLASITAAISLPVFLAIYNEPEIFQVLGIVVAVVGIIRHKENIRRLVRGEEKKFR